MKNKKTLSLIIFSAFMLLSILYASFANAAVCAPWEGGACVSVTPPTISSKPQASACASSIPSGLTEGPCTSQAPDFFSTCNGVTKCYYKSQTDSQAGTAETTTSSQSQGLSFNWLWNITKWPGYFISAFSAGWHNLTNFMFQFSSLK